MADMLVEAANWSADWKKKSRRRVLSAPATAHYIAGWPRDTDLGVIAETDGAPAGAADGTPVRVADAAPAGPRDGADRAPVGAAWLRFLPADDPGYGFVAPDVPELTIGVARDRRGRGVGRALLQALAGQASSAGIRQISLSVERRNFAQKLYLSEGYQVVDASDAQSDTMVKDLAAGYPGS
jgi:GNAT superfamily N-acetyltransferase